MTTSREQPVVIQGDLPRPMLGLLTGPGESVAPSGMGVVIVNGGAQYRAGAHRLFVQLARHLAEQGHAVLRFDFPGQGDSPGEAVGFEDTAPHIGAAIDALHQQCTTLQQTTLLGLCDGASASLLYLHTTQDPRITHLALFNPWVHSETVQARTQLKHYYRQRLLMPDFWRKLLQGEVGWSALTELNHKLRMAFQRPRGSAPASCFQERMASAWHAHKGPLLLVLSENDQTAQEFKEHATHSEAWHQWSRRTDLRLLTLTGADHTFSVPGTQEQVRAALEAMLKSAKEKAAAPRRATA